MKLLLLFGNCAVGKMTVGREFIKITPFRLFHNHMTIEPVLEVFGKFLSDNSFISPADTARIIKERFAFPEE